METNDDWQIKIKELFEKSNDDDELSEMYDKIISIIDDIFSEVVANYCVNTGAKTTKCNCPDCVQLRKNIEADRRLDELKTQ